MFILFILLSISLFSCAQESKTSIPNRVFSATDQNLSFNKNGTVTYCDTLYSGTVITRYENSLVQNSSSYYEGKQEGYSIGFYINRDTAFVRTYRSGKKHGVHRAWYPNRQLKFKYHFSEGFNVGNHREWYKTGQIFTSKNYIKGKEQGQQRVWRLDGKLRANYVVRENGRKYGVTGMKRCKNLNTKLEIIEPIQTPKIKTNQVQ